jgi:uncharacterized protein YggE
MKRWTVMGALAVGFLFVAGFVLWGQPRPEAGSGAKKEPRQLSTWGAATVRVKPDSARVFFGVQTLAPTIKEARDEGSQKIKKVLDALAALHIPDLKMKTSDVSVELVQRAIDHDKLPVTLGYRVTNSFTVLIRGDDPQKLGLNAGHVLDSALENGANQVQQVVLFRQDETEAKREALTRAVKDATANAQALADGAGARITDTVRIDGQPEYYGGRSLSNTVQGQIGFGGGGETPILAGEVEITCRVSVTCTY